MHRSTLVLLAASAIGVVAGATGASAQDDLAKKDSLKLQGTWQVIEIVQESGNAEPASDLKDVVVDFKEDTMVLRKSRDDNRKPSMFMLDPSKQPKWIDVKKEGRSDTLAQGIYKLDGDDLTLCIANKVADGTTSPRPTEFKASKVENCVLIVMKRAK